jgi:hypothetical protein
LAKQDDKAFDQAAARAIALIGQAVADDYESVVQWQQQLREAIQELVIQRAEPAFNRKLASLPQATLAEKQELSRWANSQLRDVLRLAIRCPKTGQAARLHADHGYNHAVGAFQTRLLGSESNYRPTKTSVMLFPLELRGDIPRREALAEYWTNKASDREKSGKERG